MQVSCEQFDRKMDAYEKSYVYKFGSCNVLKNSLIYLNCISRKLSRVLSNRIKNEEYLKFLANIKDQMKHILNIPEHGFYRFQVRYSDGFDILFGLLYRVIWW